MVRVDSGDGKGTTDRIGENLMCQKRCVWTNLKVSVKVVQMIRFAKYDENGQGNRNGPTGRLSTCWSSCTKPEWLIWRMSVMAFETVDWPNRVVSVQIFEVVR